MQHSPLRLAPALFTATILLASCAQTPAAKAPQPPAAPEPPPAMTMGNGAANWIITDGATRNGSTFTFPEVQIDGPGWLVMHPFENGKPNGDIYVGASYLADGSHSAVDIEINREASAGDMFIVMLHSDVDQDQNFDFVFVGNTGQVEDKAVFEGSKMIGQAYRSP
ncbi:MAG: hypothetical protein AB8B93_15020 [Pseudomonadales bacterium]